jgi:hypothetical protein
MFAFYLVIYPNAFPGKIRKNDPTGYPIYEKRAAWL